jgi:hypothetical protein
MLAIVQHCPAPDCQSDVRYLAAHKGMSREFLGTCGYCGRKYRLVNGRPAEIGRSQRMRKTGSSNGLSKRTSHGPSRGAEAS